MKGKQEEFRELFSNYAEAINKPDPCYQIAFAHTMRCKLLLGEFLVENLLKENICISFENIEK